MGPLRQLKTVFVHNIGQNRCHRDSLLFRVWGGTFLTLARYFQLYLYGYLSQDQQSLQSG